jgi:multisubunit Na+/H+ antiporter MnhB subunit
MNRNEPGMSLVVKTVTRLTVGLILVYGIYITFYGHLSPGGGFGGGVIVALALIHYVLAYGKKVGSKSLGEDAAKVLESISGIMFVTVGLVGLLTAILFFVNIFGRGAPLRLFGPGSVLACDIALSLSVAAGLFSVFVILVLSRITAKPPKQVKHE